MRIFRKRFAFFRVEAMLRLGRIRCLIAILCLILTVWFASPVFADGISFDLPESTVTGTSGGTATFLGTVTNNSGTDLMASDFFFNFFGYDFSLVTPIFSVLLSVWSHRVQLSRFKSSSKTLTSDAQTVTVSVPTSGGGTSVPEPPSLPLFVVGLCAVCVAHRKFKN
jgi:hypothetical protein